MKNAVKKRLRPPPTFSLPVAVKPDVTSLKDPVERSLYKSMANSGGKDGSWRGRNESLSDQSASEHLYGTARDAPAVQRGIGRAHGVVPLEAVYPAFGVTDGQRTG